jgi:hypothetical protein
LRAPRPTGCGAITNVIFGCQRALFCYVHSGRYQAWAGMRDVGADEGGA